jgi:deoxyribodipyrimidine photo-lyase
MFDEGALADAARRAGQAPVRLHAGPGSDLARWAAEAGASQIVTPYVAQGPVRDWLVEAQPALAARGIALCEWRRDWDSAIWPHATAGFFKVKQQMPRLLAELAPAA